MSLARGDLVWVAAKGPYTSKPRPALVVQASATLAARDSVTVCLLTGDLIDAPLFRVRLRKSGVNRLVKTSDVMVDKILTLPKSALSENAFGRVNGAQLAAVNMALRFWLDL
jgi:mRNA interferase MazF